MIRTTNPGATFELGRRIGERLTGGELILLSGDLGAGKTQLAKGIVAGAGSDDEVVSPSFTLERRYAGRMPMRHIDLYRLAGTDFPSLGIDEALLEGDTVLVEWGERLAHTDSETIRVRIEFADEEEARLIAIESPESSALHLALREKEFAR